MRIATWNVNSIRTRVDRVVGWAASASIDVLAMQEIKCRESQFPFAAFAAAGYRVEMVGLNQWNGVAFAYREDVEASDFEVGFAGMPGWGPDEAAEARALGGTFNGVRLWSLYVPNGRDLNDPHYEYKLRWLDALAATTEEWLTANPSKPLALMGDWNIAPLDSDVWSPEFFADKTHTSPPERAAFARFEQIGLTDVVRPIVPSGYTYWDYRQGRYDKDEGMRIDFIMGNASFEDQVLRAMIARSQREGVQPSDHVPVAVDIA